MLLPLGIMGAGARLFKLAETAVCFNISLVNNIDSVHIAKIEHKRVRRIVGGADAVNIVILTNFHISFNILGAHRIALFLVGVVMVDAEKLYGFVIKIKNITLNLNMLKADKAPYTLADLALFTEH